MRDKNVARDMAEGGDIFKLSRIYTLFAHHVHAHYIDVFPVYRIPNNLLSADQLTPPAQRIQVRLAANLAAAHGSPDTFRPHGRQDSRCLAEHSFVCFSSLLPVGM